MRTAIRTALAAGALAVGVTVIAACALFDYFTDPRPYPLGRRRP